MTTKLKLVHMRSNVIAPRILEAGDDKPMVRT